MIRKIVLSNDPILRRQAKPVSKIDKKVKDLIKDLKDTLAVQKNPEGVGLAAPQIGKGLRVFLAKDRDFERVIINPEILEIQKITKKNKVDRRKKEILEGCLSIPFYYGPLERSPKVTVRYLSESGRSLTETFEGFRAQIILHEIDHLEGVLFVDHIISEGKSLYKVEGDEWEEVELI
jgi:peptide deformylase